jgi:hypothetical protein
MPCQHTQKKQGAARIISFKRANTAAFGLYDHTAQLVRLRAEGAQGNRLNTIYHYHPLPLTTHYRSITTHYHPLPPITTHYPPIATHYPPITTHYHPLPKKASITELSRIP